MGSRMLCLATKQGKDLSEHLLMLQAGDCGVADGAIVGTALKEDGILKNPISFELTSELMKSLRK